MTLDLGAKAVDAETCKLGANCHDAKPKESRKQINAWVAKATRKQINAQVFNPEDDDNADTVHVIANAIYFKGEWRNPFKKENTVDREFHRLDGSSVEVPFLQSWSYQCIAWHSGFKVLKLPYEMMNEYNWNLYDSLPRFYMSVFLPDGKKGLRNIVEKIASPRRSCTTTYPRSMSPSASSGCQSSS
ncbi:serpin-Z2B-like [Miscanthus floridulus]|uniref:serpin-Z2B-like n=1 Tax=Miscanthus floridulus TaxID=154761 RepID=UPI00345B449B